MQFVLLLCLATSVLAVGDSVVSLFIPDTDPQPLVASIIAQNSATTTWSVNCPSGTQGESCGMGPGLFLTTAPTSVEYLISDKSGDIYDHVICLLTGTTSGVCTATITGHGANFPGTSTSTLNQDQITSLPVTVTAGPRRSTAAATSTSSRTGPTPPPTSATSSIGNIVSSSLHPTTQSTPSHSQTGGAALVTRSPELIIIGGAIAAIGGF